MERLVFTKVSLDITANIELRLRESQDQIVKSHSIVEKILKEGH